MCVYGRVGHGWVVRQSQRGIVGIPGARDLDQEGADPTSRALVHPPWPRIARHAQRQRLSTVRGLHRHTKARSPRGLLDPGSARSGRSGLPPDRGRPLSASPLSKAHLARRRTRAHARDSLPSSRCRAELPRSRGRPGRARRRAVSVERQSQSGRRPQRVPRTARAQRRSLVDAAGRTPRETAVPIAIVEGFPSQSRSWRRD